MKAPFLMLGLLAAVAGVSHAADKVYKWKDSSGIVHFSDAPPPTGTTFENVRVVGQNTPVASAGGGDTTGTDEAAKAPPTDERARRCADAQQRVTLLEGKHPLVTGQPGNQRPLEGAERAGELQIAQATVASLCDAPPDAS